MNPSQIRQLLTKILVDIMFFGGIVSCIVVPFILPWIMSVTGAPPQYQIVYTAVLLGAGLSAVYILYQLKRMFKTLVGGNPFVGQNVTCLRKCAVASAVIALVFIVRLIFWFTIAASVIAIIFSLLSLFCLTIKDLFKQAVAYKEETDWTV